MVGGSGFDYYDGSLITDVILGNYARIQDSADFTSLLIVSDPTGREVISSSLFDIYGNGSGSIGEQMNGLFTDIERSGVSPLRTDTALRLMPLLNGEELSRMTDSELQEFLRNLPLLGVEQRRGSGHLSGSSPAAEESQEPAVPEAAEDAIIPETAVNNPAGQNGVWGPTDNHSESGYVGDAADVESEYTLPSDASLSDSLAVGLLLAANVAGQRGWRLGRLSDEESVIQGDLQDLRKTQTSRKYSIWQK
jgi:hypothetical protein